MAKICGFSALVAITVLQLRLSPRVILFVDRYSLRCGEFSRDFPCYLASQDHLLVKTRLLQLSENGSVSGL